MFSSAEKTNHNAVAIQQKTQQQTFFRKAEEETFFGTKKQTSFFNTNTPVQAKLSVSSPDDPQEKEADTVADQVMRMPDVTPAAITQKEEKKLNKKEEEEIYPKIEAPAISKLSCKEDEEIQTKQLNQIHHLPDENKDSGLVESLSDQNTNNCVYCKQSASIPSKMIQRSGRDPPAGNISFDQTLSSSKGSGSALPDDTRQFMESRFNADFSGVRIHAGSEAQQMTSSIQAQAFAHGSDIYFNDGKYSPQTQSGGTLLAHELTHTIQQGGSTANPSTSISTKSLGNQNNPKIHRREMASQIPGQIDFFTKSGGHQLSEAAKEYFENYFNTDLSGIRIYSDNEVATICKENGVSAFVKNKNIGINPSKYNPESEDGAMLLSDQVAESLRQQGIRTTSTDGNSTSEGLSLRDIIKNAIKENKGKEEKAGQSKKKEVSDLNKTLSENKKDGLKKETKAANKKEKRKKRKGRNKSKKGEGKILNPLKRNPQKSPSTPAEDPAFLKVVKKTKATAKNQKVHEPAEKKSAESQNSAAAVPKEAEGKAQIRKTTGMSEAAKEDRPFDAESFKADLLKKIESITPKTLEEATEFKENNKINDVKSAMGEKVSAEKQNSTGPVNNATTQPLEVNPTDNKQPVKLPPTPAGPAPASVGAKGAVPKKKLGEEISMDKQSQSLDDEMKANNVTEDQLASSNEPTFSAALEEKKGAQKDAVEKPKVYRKEEMLSLKQAQTNAVGESAQSLSNMHNARGKDFSATVIHQQTAKQKNEELRAQVTRNIEEKYKLAEEKVKISLEKADKEANTIFDEGSESARSAFENYVGIKMSEYKRKRYSGFWGGLRWAKDKLFGMPDAVNVFYKEGRDLYLKEMDGVITKVADTVTLRLNEAKKAITDGKKDINDYVEKLPKDLQEVGKEATDSIMDKFDSLEQSINDKRDGLIDGLAKKYVDNVKKLDDRINELKDANKGLVDKAIGFLKKVWQVIKDLTNLFMTILARLASIIGTILSSPSGFFSNLGKAFRIGFDNFKNKFLEYLEKGLMEWLATNLGIAGIELPEKFDASAIFSLALQVMGITKVHIRERAVVLLGERKVKLLEKGGGLIYRVYNEGLGVIWDMIIEKLRDFKELVWDAITSFIKKSIIEAALTFILSLLSPIGAFIKVCMAIYDFLMMLVRFKDRIIELLDSILGAVMNIASGAVDGAAAIIEKALAKSISVIIGFLAALLHLNNIFTKIRDIITRIQKRVEKAIDWVIGKAYSLVGGLVEGALRLEDKATAIVEKGKAAVVGAGKKVAGAVMGWLGLKKKFTSNSGQSHEVYFKKQTDSGQLIIESDPTPVKSFLSNRKHDLQKDASMDNTKKAELLDKAKQAQNLVKGIEELTYPPDRNAVPAETAEIEIFEKSELLIALLKVLDPAGTNQVIPAPTFLPGFTNGSKAQFFEAYYLSDYPAKNYQHGEDASRYKGDLSGALRLLGQMGVRAKWVAFHIVNENYGGKATDSNLIPAPQYINKDYRVAFEDKLKLLLSQKHPIWMKFKCDYRGSTSFLQSLSAKGGGMKFQNNQWVQDASLEVPAYSKTIDEPKVEKIDINSLEKDPDLWYFYEKETALEIGSLDFLAAEVKKGIRFKNKDEIKKHMETFFIPSTAPKGRKTTLLNQVERTNFSFS